MASAADLIEGLSAFPRRAAGSDAERRAATWLAGQLRAGRRTARIETFWCRPSWALAQSWHLALGLAGSLVAVGSPHVGAVLIDAASLQTLAEAIRLLKALRTPQHPEL